MTERAEAHDALARLAQGDLSVLHPEAIAEAPHPFATLAGPELAAFWQDLRRALPDGERRDDLFLMGANREDARVPGPRPSPMVACLGAYIGTFQAPFAGILPTGRVVALTYGEAHHFEDGRLKRSWLVWDLFGLMRQAGIAPQTAPLGAVGHWPAPLGGTGLRLTESPPSDSLDRVLDMHAALHAFDGQSVEDISMAHWAPDFTYWAAGPIGASRGVDGFRAHHQRPFLRAFPDRRGAGHFIRISDGPFAVTGGDVAMTHTGTYLGIPATGRALRFRVMDFYRFDAAGLIAENWLPNDMAGLMAQMGNDPFRADSPADIAGGDATAS
ncbi:MAG: ester cyclase [Pseudomonadota bacterium]